MDYILEPKHGDCVFCLPEDPQGDAQRMVLARGKCSFVIINKFPYNNGHLLVAPLRHAADITDLDVNEHTEIMWFIQHSVRVLREKFNAQGFNIGMNLGAVAGAGVPGHVHFHIVPRWSGDASFVTVVGEIRFIPQHMEETYAALLPQFARLCPA
jgi:ATP adenylyltransferase